MGDISSVLDVDWLVSHAGGNVKAADSGYPTHVLDDEQYAARILFMTEVCIE
jgi:hypothetical protein